MHQIIIDKLLDKKELVESYLNQTPRKLSTHSFVSIFLWKDFFEFDFEVIDDNLCVFAKNEIGSFLYLPPLGCKISLQAVQQSFEIMRKRNEGLGVSRIENFDAEFQCEGFKNVFKANEYFYNREELADLAGHKYKSHRHECHLFENSHKAQFLEYNDSMFDECVHLYDRWAEEKRAKNKDEIFLQLIDENKIVHLLGLRNFEKLNLIGRVIVVNKEVAGYTFGYELNNDTFCILFEITDFKYKGLPSFIFREFCRDDTLKKYAFVNTMDDWGLDNVKKTKMSWHPCEVVGSFNLVEK